MNITYKNPGCEYSLSSLALFLTENEAPFWSEPILHFYPQICKDKLNQGERQRYLREVLQGTYEQAKADIDDKILRYNAHFADHRGQIENALSDAFQTDARSAFNDLTAHVTLNPICPRFLKERRFDIFYMSSERGALGLSLHEVIHYFWFDVWNRHFGDAYDEYENPSLKWILSEMVVESIMSDPRLSALNPYYPRENGGCVYPYFQDMVIDGHPILNTIQTFYQKNRIVDFMEIAYAYCIRHESAIRRHIHAGENNLR